MNDSDGGGRCCSARKRTSQTNTFHSGPAWLLSSCEDAAAFLCIQSKILGERLIPGAGAAMGKGLAVLCRITGLVPFPLRAKGEMAV